MFSKHLYVTGLRLFIIVLLVLGVFFRFVNLDRKVYWIDEVHTSVRVAGYGKKEFVDLIPKAQVIGIEEFQKYQRLTPDRDLGDALNSLAGNSEHSPFYYLMARFWMQWFGSSVVVTRSLAAFISLLAFPCIYWLSQELFASPLVGWMAIALMAVSPFHVLYAQEARQYSLWAVTILLSSGTLLWVLRDRDEKIPVSKWAIYALTVAAGLYAHLLFAMTLLGHGIYLIFREGWREKAAKSRIVAYLLASLAGIIAFLPWLVLFVNDSDGIGGWVARKMPFATLMQRWAINLSSLFLDIQIGFSERLFDIESVQDTIQLGLGNPFTYLILLILGLIGYSIYFLCRHTEKQVWLFILTLILIPGLILALPDLISGGQRSTIGRYLTPCYLGIQLAVAYLLATKMTSLDVKVWQQKLWQGVIAVLVSLGVLSCAIASQAETWWNKYSCYDNPQLAQFINQVPSPLIISGPEKASRLTSLSYELKPSVGFLLLEDPNQLKIPNSFTDVFLFRPSEDFIQALQQHPAYKVEPVSQLRNLWQLFIGAR